MPNLIYLRNGKLVTPRLTPRSVRYQVARFCEWDDDGRVAAGSRYVPSELPDHQRRIETKPDEYKYKITPHSLTKAKEQGLKVEQLLSFARKTF